MGHILSLLAAALASNHMALADPVLGRMTLTVHPARASGFYVTEIRQEGNRILGHTSFGANSLVSLKLMPGSSAGAGNSKYSGIAGGDGFTDLECVPDKCDGTIGGRSTYFDVQHVAVGSAMALNLKGALNFSPLRVTKTENEIKVSVRGSMELKRVGEGKYEGVGALNGDPFSEATFKLETSGSLKDLDDPGLVAIFLGNVVMGDSRASARRR